MRRIVAAIVGAVFVASSLSIARAAEPLEHIDTAVAATSRAEFDPAAVATDVVSINNRANVLSADVQNRAMTAFLMARGSWALGRGASVGMDAVRRGAAVVQQTLPGYHVPMSTTVLPTDAVAALMGRNVASVLASGFIVMGRKTADLRGAAVGDAVDLVAADGGTRTFGIGMVADDSVLGGTELLVSPEQADVLGVTTVTRIVGWGFESRAAFDSAFVATGLSSFDNVRIRRSWDPPDPDSTLGLASTKALLGEFAYRERGDTFLDLTPEWVAAALPAGRELLIPQIPIVARCHNAIVGDLRAALTEVAAAGLGGQIEVGNANTYGGCFGPRFNRISGALGFVSRHTWAQALDTNTVSNAQGARPRMNCDVVRIFRKHNFAWGGNFLTPDGMHFEWVGERRDLLQYPSLYCPNIVDPTRVESLSPAPVDDTQRSTLFADDGWAPED